ncbi:protein of unknown function [Halpernia humi]|uniref:DUF4287 domain-containing protein n=1 Tax=Halpernia humi TaxID=493375 RepID=A0A1H6BN64_9FLAO|nr:DUF4287 domain-containing protein [Halpernia humi]SEG61895.1 protein of unknown function [Halpernia humi]
MINNLYKNTGKTLEQWIEIVKSQNFAKHGEIIKFLKEKHGFTHGFANLVAHKANKSDAGSFKNQNDLITKQYQNKEHFKLLYDKLISEIQNFWLKPIHFQKKQVGLKPSSSSKKPDQKKLFFIFD